MANLSLFVLLLILVTTTLGKDITRCEKYRIDCGPKAKCVNEGKSYYCQCEPDTHYDGKACRDGGKLEWDWKGEMCKSASCPSHFTGNHEDCLERCGQQERCVMVKFLASRKRCWLCKKTQLRRSKKNCDGLLYSFHVKVENRVFRPPIKVTPQKVSTKIEKKVTESVKKQQAKNTTPLAPKQNTAGTRLAEAKRAQEVMGKKLYAIIKKQEKDLILKNWAMLESLCVGIERYETFGGKSPEECVDICEYKQYCLMAKYSQRDSICWLSGSRKMTGFKNCEKTYDYYVKRLDECDENRKCKPHATCKIEKGHKYCECREGFYQKKAVCKDINECTKYRGLCGKNAHCVNTLGSYTCECNAGLIGNGYICVSAKLPHASSFMENLT